MFYLISYILYLISYTSYLTSYILHLISHILQCPTQLSSGMLGPGEQKRRQLSQHPVRERTPFGTTGTQYNVAVVRVDSPPTPLILLYRPNGVRVPSGQFVSENRIHTESTPSPLGSTSGPPVAHC